MNRIFAITTRGLEPVCAQEIETLPGLVVDHVGYRRIAAECKAPLASLLSLRTADDVFVEAAQWTGIGRPRSALEELQRLSAQLDLRAAVKACASARHIAQPPTFSVTANFVGRRNYSAEEIKQAVSEGILVAHSAWAYSPDDRNADLNVRLFAEHETVHVGLRIGPAPLHRRPYKTVHVPGSLKPSVAAALVLLVQAEPGMRILDPCCGAGTIPIEAALIEAAQMSFESYESNVVGGDIDSGAIAAARINAQTADVSFRPQEWDARELPIAAASIESIVCNLPWGREVRVSADVQALYEEIVGEMRRVLVPHGRIVLLTNAPHLLDLKGMQCEREIEISLFGQTPTIVILHLGS